MPFSKQHPRTGAAVVAIAALIASLATWPAAQSPADPITPTDGWADERRCAECHTQTIEFSQTGHANTLRRAVDVRSTSLLSRFAELRPDPAASLHLQITDDAVLARDLATGTPRALTLDWCFGSGKHACTWVGTLPDSWGATDLVEFRWTWYPDSHAFDLTPGQPVSHGDGYFGRLGVLFDPPKARRCFGCHATRLPVAEGAIDEARIHPGVTCQRCHGPQKRHVASDGDLPPESLQSLGQAESVARCAQCHRSPEDRDAHEITTDNKEIVRFQPIGLLQSACFQQSPQMTCITCHDPHRPLQSQDSQGIWQCTQCHDPATPQSVLCAAGKRDDCIDCHMPKVRGEAPVFFTDHWIRERDDAKVPE